MEWFKLLKGDRTYTKRSFDEKLTTDCEGSGREFVTIGEQYTVSVH
jgi:hypothetical protein